MDTPKPDAVEKIANLAKDAHGLTLHSVSVPAVSGLPTSISFGFDHRNLTGGGIKDLRDIVEKWRQHPERRKGTAQVLTLQSFIDLVNRHKSVHSAIFASTNWPNPSLTAVIDYHDIINRPPAPETDTQGIPVPLPRFCEHRVHYPFPVTDEFKEWAENDGESMNQAEFAAFIEDRLPELAQATFDEEKEIGKLFGTKLATPADMLALSRGLEVNVAGKVKNNVRLSSGEGELVFVEEHLNNKGEKITVPGMFMICLPVFIDGEPVRLPVRLRYRVSDGAVSWSYHLYRWKELVRERVVADLETAATETALPAYEGSPER